MMDKNYESHYEDGEVIADRVIVPPNLNEISDTLKFSNCANVTVRNCTIEGGKEDCIDAVRGENYTFTETILIPHKNGITLKGSIVNYNINNITYNAHGSDCDMEFGQYDNYWYIGRKATRGGIIDTIKADDGKPIKIKLWDADMPAITNTNVKVIKVPKIIWWPYFVFRCIQVRGIKNIFKPVDSGSFISTK